MRRFLRKLLRIAWKTLLVGAVLFALVALIYIIRINVARDEGFDIVLITIDTQRADHLGCYGSEEADTPNTDRLAERGVAFRNTIVTIPRTTQNVCSIMTGRYPQEHGARYLASSLDESETTLAEILQEKGFRTAAFVGGGPMRESQNIYQGFDHVVTYAKKAQPGALPMVSKAIGWLLGNYHENYFLWVHLFDDHFPYTPPWPFWSSDHPKVDEVQSLYAQLRSGKRTFGEFHFENDLSEETRDYLRELYRGEVAYTDRAVGLLLRTVGLLNTLDPGRRTLVIYTADHGESLGEHEYYFQHGNYLYDPDLRVPLILSFPEEIPGGESIDTQVRSIDILPTVLELLGETVPKKVTGKSLLPMIRGEREPHRVAFAESDDRQYPQNPRYHLEGIPGRWRAVSDGHRKLIRIPHPEGDIHELYDLEKDPEELTNLYPAAAEEAAPLMALLDAWMASASPGADEAPEMDEETLEMLRSMGYVN